LERVRVGFRVRIRVRVRVRELQIARLEINELLRLGFELGYRLE
jgi:hypothetical protein